MGKRVGVKPRGKSALISELEFIKNAPISSGDDERHYWEDLSQRRAAALLEEIRVGY